jgi:acyl-CoA synthetase (AMP-forming)/AMP-acid ligase II/acyl carrier protein
VSTPVADLRPFLEELLRLGVRLREEQGRLRAQAPPGVLTGALALRLGQNREAILTLLRSTEGARPAPAAALAPVGQPLPLAWAQEDLWAAEQLAPGRSAFTISVSLDLAGTLRVDSLHRALDAVVRRHAALRTVFVSGDGGARQRVLEPASPQLVEDDLSTHSADARRRRCAEIEEEEVHARFDLRRPAFRVRLVRLSADSWTLLLSVHHIVCDAWSAGLLVRDLAAAWAATAAGRDVELPPPAFDFPDFAFAERGDDEARFAADVLYWRAALAGWSGPGSLPADRARTDPPTFAGAAVPFALGRGLGDGLLAIAKEQGATLFMALLAGLSALLGRYADCDDVAVGSPTSGRFRPGTRDLVGCFAYPVVLRSDLSGRPSLREALRRARDTALGAYAHQEVPFSRVMRAIGEDARRGFGPLVDVMFSFPPAEELLGLPARLDIPGLSVLPRGQRAATPYDLFLLVEGALDGRGTLTYATDRFDAPTAGRVSAHLVRLLTAAVAEPDRPLAGLAILDEGERRAIADLGAGVGLPALVVLEAAGERAPIGAVGEIARTSGEGVVRTGERGRVRSDGTLERLGYFGRVATVDGQRVDLGRVESALLAELPGADVAALVRRRDGGGEELIVAVASAGMAGEALRDRVAHAAQALAEERRPDGVVAVARVPLRGDGGVDESALAGLPVLDAAVARGAEDALRALGAVEAAAMVVEVTPEAARLHLEDLLPASFRSDEGTPVASTITAAAPENRPPAYADGGPLRIPEGSPRTLVEALLQTATRHPENGVTFVDGGGVEVMVPWPELLVDARSLLTGLRGRGLAAGDRVILQVAGLRAHFTAFWACVLGGIVPVTVALAPSYRESNAVVQKLANAWRLLGRPRVLTSEPLVSEIQGLAVVAGMAGVETIALDGLGGVPAAELHAARPEDLVFFQLTSGSTGIPKCIQETHRGIIAHALGSAETCAYAPANVVLNWLPVDHVVPILTIHLKDVVVGCREIQVALDRILSEPLRWLDLIEAHSVTHTWAPNFAFKLVADRLAAEEVRPRDLRSVRYFMNAGEQVTLPVLQEFLAQTAGFGVAPQSLQPSFGMAEVCTCMTYQTAFDEATGVHFVDKSSLGGALRFTDGAEAGRTAAFVDLGPPMPGVEIRIADAENAVVPEGTVGRFQIRGASVTPGYVDNDEANREAFVGDGWFNSGDLGFIRRGRLTLTGREKEMIIVRGANFYCYEIEDVVNGVGGVEPTCSAAVGIADPVTGTEALAILFVSRSGGAGEPALVREIRTRVAQQIGVTPTFVVPLLRAEFPKTTSGKIQRTQLRKNLVSGAYRERLRALDLALGNERTVPSFFHERVLVPHKPRQRPWGRVGTVAVSGAPAIVAALQARRETVTLCPDAGALSAAIAEPAVTRALLRTDDGADLLAVAQGLSRRPEDRPLRLVVASADRAAGLAALVRTLAQEHRLLFATHVDVAEATASGVPALIAELDEIGEELEVVLRGRGRFVPRLRAAAPVPQERALVERGAFYVVSGGLGGVGKLVAHRLLRELDTRLLLIGLSATKLPESLGAHSSHARVARVDVADATALKLAITAGEAAFGLPCRGAFHLAGAYHEAALAEETADGLGRARHAKVEGARALGSVLRRGALFVGFSSVNATFGGFRAGAYAAANRGLEAVTRELSEAGLRTLLVEWSQWLGVGISRGFALRDLGRARGFLALDPGEAELALLAALHGRPGHVIVGLDPTRPAVRRVLAEGPIEREAIVAFASPAVSDRLEARDRYGVAAPVRVRSLDRWPRDADGRTDRGALEALAAGASIRAEPGTESEKAVADLWRDVLGVRRVGLHDSFFDVGGHSLAAVQMIARLEERFAITFPVAALFEATTVQKLAVLVDALTAARAGAPAELAGLEVGEI